MTLWIDDGISFRFECKFDLFGILLTLVSLHVAPLCKQTIVFNQRLNS